MHRTTTVDTVDRRARKAKIAAPIQDSRETSKPSTTRGRTIETGVEAGVEDHPLLACAQGRLSRRDTIRLLGLRDSAELLVMLGDAGLSAPQDAPDEIEKQAVLFETLWRQS